MVKVRLVERTKKGASRAFLLYQFNERAVKANAKEGMKHKPAATKGAKDYSRNRLAQIVQLHTFNGNVDH